MRGRFVWHDLMTTDGERARAFYPELLGWKLVPLKMGSFTVWLIEHGGIRIGTIMEEPGLGRSHWMPYVSVESVESACRRIAELGGKVCVAPTEIPKLGRFSVVEDPEGAIFSVIRRPEGIISGSGPFVWNELSAIDPERVSKFYAQLFDWQIERIVTDEPYWRSSEAGFVKSSHSRAQWIGYLHCESVDLSARRAQSLGAKMLYPPTDIPGIGRFSQLADPTGAPFALFRES
jgi:predicted enzyme related to lactoylglutathione lyase